MPDNINKGYGNEMDLSYLRDIASGSAEFMIEMIDIFLKQTPIYFNQLEAAVKERNWKEVASVAHKIKPTLVFMGVNTAKQDLESIEHKARSLENLEDVDSQFTAVQQQCANLFVKLKQVKADLEAEL